MTQYYEPEARELESRANRSTDHAEQNRLWAEAARIGTPVELDQDGDEIRPNPKTRALKRLVTTVDDIGRVQAMINEWNATVPDYPGLPAMRARLTELQQQVQREAAEYDQRRNDDFGPFYRD